MTKVKMFTVCTLILTLLLSSFAMADNQQFAEKEAKAFHKSEKQLKNITPRRDEDDHAFYWMYTSDGGANWGDVVSLGDLGMYADAETPAWGDADNFEVLIGTDGKLHFFTALDAFTEFNNPDGHENGVYHIWVDADGQNRGMEMIAAEGEDDVFWVDPGMDADGNFYCIYIRGVTEIVEEEEITTFSYWGAKQTDDGWTNRMLTDDIDDGNMYPHMAPKVGPDYFYVIYQKEGETYHHHYVLKVPSSLEGDVVTYETPALTGAAVYYTYADLSINPIEYDPDYGENGFILFAVRDEYRDLDTTGTYACH